MRFEYEAGAVVQAVEVVAEVLAGAPRLASERLEVARRAVFEALLVFLDAEAEEAGLVAEAGEIVLAA